MSLKQTLNLTVVIIPVNRTLERDSVAGGEHGNLMCNKGTREKV